MPHRDVGGEGEGSSWLVLRHTQLEGLGLIGNALREVGIHHRYLDLPRGEPIPRDLRDVGGLIVLGGPMGAYQVDRYPFLIPETTFIERALTAGRPVLGVCLGHQSLVEVLGGKIVRAGRLMHGKTSPVHHDGRGVFAGLPAPFEAGRYHSLIADPASLPKVLELSARTPEGEIMGVRHREWFVEGVQFHPESILTPDGPRLLGNFLEMKSGRRS